MTDRALSAIDFPEKGESYPVLVINAGSSSIKFAVAWEPENLWLERGEISGIGGQPSFQAINCREEPRLPDRLSHEEALNFLLDWLDRRENGPSHVGAVGHRIVHGGARLTSPVIVTPEIAQELRELERLAPLHMPAGVSALRRVIAHAPHIPNIACFDTAFHATQPEIATRLPLPRAYYDRGYRRYGFHGLNYEHIVGALPKASGKPLPRRLLAAHLGAGSSICAIVEGKSVATTMGYSTADGLIMATRTGSIDPGVIIALLQDEKLGAPELEDLLYRKSGLLGISGLTSDMRTLLASDRPEAKEAVEHYCYAAARHAASLVAAMGGLDALVFTGGIGQNAHFVRARIIEHLQWLGLKLDASPNAPWHFEISANVSSKPIYVMRADEEGVIADHVLMAIRNVHT
jgi:acetate kinase